MNSRESIPQLAAVCFAGLLAAGCATWSHSTVEGAPQAAPATAARPSNPTSITVTEADTNRKYTSLGDITVTVNKTTAFHAAPTRDGVNQALREEAAKLGADAVILVRYGTVGVSFMSWGSLEGKGRAIKYVQ